MKKGSGIAILNLTYQATKHLVEISLAVTAVLSVKCEQTDIGLHYILTVTMPDVSTTGNDSEKVASVALVTTVDNTGGLFG